MDDTERKLFFIQKMEIQFEDYCIEHYDVPCIYIGSGKCSNCKGLSYDHNLGCKLFLDGWTQAVKLLTQYK